MANSFPGSVKTFQSKTSGQVIGLTHLTDLDQEVSAIETVLLNGPLTMGNSTVNTVFTNTSVTISNSTVNTAHTSAGLTVGANVTVNATTVFVGNSTVNTAHTSAGLTVGANVTVNATTVFVGNSTVNTAITGTGITLTGNLTASGTVSMGSSFLRNRIINGGMDIWQRGTSTTSIGNTYLADRWQSACATGGTVSQETTSLPTGSRYAWKFVASATNSYAQMGQQIEYFNCIDLQNTTVTISFMACAVTSTAGSTALTVRTRTIAGVDGACMFAGTNSDTAVTLTTTWTRYTVTRSLPASFGSLSLEFVLGSHISGDGIMLSQVQLEIGSVATPFERRLYTTELALCQRYYWQGGNGAAGIQNSGTTARYDVRYPVTMRSAPTIAAIAAPNSTNPTVTESTTGSQTTNFSATAAGGLVTDYCASKIQFGGFSSFSDGRPCNLLNTCLSFSAEF